MATLEYRNHPNERPLTGTITLKISRNNLPEKILTLVTKCKRGREEREQESAIGKLLIHKDQLITLRM